MKLKQKQLTETNKSQDIDEELDSVRKEHVTLIGKQGELLAQEKVGSVSLCSPICDADHRHRRTKGGLQSARST